MALEHIWCAQHSPQGQANPQAHIDCIGNHQTHGSQLVDEHPACHQVDSCEGDHQ
jgi:hypothetical protein